MAEENKNSDNKTETKTTSTAAAQAPKAPEAVQLDVLQMLKNKADTLGIGYGVDIDVAALKTKIENKLAGLDTETPVKVSNQELRQKAYEAGMRLVRVRITNMNPSKSDLQGEIFTFSNRYLGEVKRYVPYGEQENGWHLEQCIYDMLKEKKYQQIRVRKAPNGQQLPETKWVPEFAFEELPPLTQQELKVLANKQAAAAGMASS